jgi:hypothetical protein
VQCAQNEDEPAEGCVAADGLQPVIVDVEQHPEADSTTHSAPHSQTTNAPCAGALISAGKHPCDTAHDTARAQLQAVSWRKACWTCMGRSSRHRWLSPSPTHIQAQVRCACQALTSVALSP